jgi:hypothetical protein
MRRSLIFITAALISLPLLASNCPNEIRKIDQELQANPPSDPAFTQRVQSLRDEGQKLHDEGKHKESMEVLGEAMEMLAKGR